MGETVTEREREREIQGDRQTDRQTDGRRKKERKKQKTLAIFLLVIGKVLRMIFYATCIKPGIAK